MLALIAATTLGFMFLDKGQDGASLVMAVTAGAAMMCYGYNIWALADARRPA